MKTKIYQLRIELMGLEPPIWRTIKIDGDATFWQLHLVIQRVMGWDNDHMFEFRSKKLRINDDTDSDFFGRSVTIDSDEITIEEVLKRKGSKIEYIYDFGDNWELLIAVEKTENGEPLKGAICLAGKRNGPPEDSGGVWGYMDKLSIIKDPKHPYHEDYLEWMGEDFDSEYFDLEETNKILTRYNK